MCRGRHTCAYTCWYLHMSFSTHAFLETNDGVAGATWQLRARQRHTDTVTASHLHMDSSPVVLPCPAACKVTALIWQGTTNESSWWYTCTKRHFCFGNKTWLWCSSFSQACGATLERCPVPRPSSQWPSLSLKAQTKLQTAIKKCNSISAHTQDIKRIRRQIREDPGHSAWMSLQDRLTNACPCSLPWADSTFLKVLANTASLIRHWYHQSYLR